MGDIQTHRAVSQAVEPLFPGSLKDEMYAYFHLGNYFTDVSQFRDPYAFASAKTTVWRQAKAKKWLARLFFPPALFWPAHLPEYLDELMGKPGSPAKLGEWFLRMNFVFGLQNFTDRPGGNSPIDKEEFKRLFKIYWTQYWPHEHVDFPPWPHLDPIGERKDSENGWHDCAKAPSTDGDKRKVHQYTEEQIRYIAESLVKIEQDWKKLGKVYNTDEKKQELHRILGKFGRTSHAVEDYYFHSNYVELAWSRMMDMEPLGDDAAVSRLWGAPDDHHSPVRMQRLYERRLRTPKADGEALSTEESEEASHVFTGSFGGSDVFHTFADAMAGLDDKASIQGMLALVGPHFGFASRHEALVLLRDEKKMDDFCQRHKDWVNGKSEPPMRGPDDAHRMIPVIKNDPDAKKAWDEAWAMDRELMNKYDKIPLGIYCFVMNMLVAAEEEEDKSQEKAAKFDSQNGEGDYRKHAVEPTDNGASGENIGCHSLMAKDSVRKKPLRVPAENLAQFVARYVAKTMIDRIFATPKMSAATFDYSKKGSGGDGDVNTSDAPAGVDWLHLLQHFMNHPAESVGDWHLEVLKANSGDFSMDTHHSLRFLTADQVAEFVDEKKKAELEEKYHALEAVAEGVWQKMIAHDKVVAGISTAAVVGGIVAGAIAGAVIGAAVGGPAGAVIGAVVGAVVGAIGGALLGGLLGAIL